MTMATVEEAVRVLQAGGLIVLMDDESRENEGDLVGLGAKMTAANVNLMVTAARGLLCAPLAPSVAKRLHLTPMVEQNTEANGTKFTFSVDGAKATTGVTTGVSAFDRARTLQKLADPAATAGDFVHPGHMFPLVAEEAGVLARAGHTEAAVDLAYLAGAMPVGAICEILLPDGHMARLTDLERFATEHALPFLTIEQLKNYLQTHGRNPLVKPR